MCEVFTLPWLEISLSSIVGWELGGFIYRRFFSIPEQQRQTEVKP